MRVDVLGIGCCAIDDVLYVDRYPPADSKMEVRRRERRCGGLTAVALMAAAKLGASSAYAGTLGEDELSRFAIDAMAEQGVQTSTVVRREGATPVHSIIVVDQQTGSRTILFDPSNTIGAHPEQPSAEVITAAGVFVDHYGNGLPDKYAVFCVGH